MRISDRVKHKVIGQMNYLIDEVRANYSAFYILTTAKRYKHFLAIKTNVSFAKSYNSFQSSTFAIDSFANK